MQEYEISVKANVEWGKPVAVRILSRNPISDSILDVLREKRLDDARRYCQSVLKATLIIK